MGTRSPSWAGLFLAMWLAGFALPAFGSDVLVIHLKDGRKIEYRLDQIEKITYGAARPLAGPLEGLIAYYPLDGSPADRSGREKHGVVHGAKPATDRKGTPDAAFAFDGARHWIDIPDDLSPAHITVAAWVNPEFSPHGDSGDMGYPIVTKETGRGTPPWSESFAWCFRITPRTHRVQLRAFTEGVGAGPESESALQAGRWYHVAATYDGKRVCVYVDGILEGAQDAQGPLITTNLPTAIGHLQGWNVQWFKGAMNEVRIYDRALSPEEVRTLCALP
jgi:hypothetical protein